MQRLDLRTILIVLAAALLIRRVLAFSAVSQETSLAAAVLDVSDLAKILEASAVYGQHSLSADAKPLEATPTPS